MVDVKERIGRFTSSQIWKLMQVDRSGKDFGAVALTYIEEKRAERSLGRSIDLGKQSQATVWGKVMEYYCNKFHLGLEYSLCSKETLVHPKYKFWSGSPDFKKPKTTGDIKCNEPKRHYQLSVNLIKLKDNLISLEDFKKLEKEVYWQVVSNCVLTNNPIGEIIAYTPTHDQLIEIREDWEVDNYVSGLNKTLSEHLEVDFQYFHYLINKEFHNLPYIPEWSEFPNFTSVEFEVPSEDVILLTKKVVEANKILENG